MKTRSGVSPQHEIASPHAGFYWWRLLDPRVIHGCKDQPCRIGRRLVVDKYDGAMSIGDYGDILEEWAQR